MQEQPHGSFHPHGGQVAPRRHPYGGGKGADKVALGDSQPLTELLHAVQASVVLADILNGGLHQRRQGRSGAVGPRKLTEQGKGQLAGSPAAGCIGLGGKAAQQLCGSGAGLAPGQERQLRQPGKELHRRLPGQLDAEQVALPFRGQGQRGAAQHQMARRRALGRQDQCAARRGGRGIGQAGSASAAGDQADPQPLAGQGQGFFGLDIPHHAKGCGACPIIKQYLTPQINKMLFYITKLSVIIIPTRACTVKVP